MPAMTDEQRQEWRDANADLIAYISNDDNCLRSRFINAMRGSYIQWGSLTEAQTIATANIMRESVTSERGIEEAALGHECPYIPNGTFTIGAGDTHWTFRIYTARRGPLQGKRIIKRLMQDGTYKGFAFVTRTGSVRVWRSYYEDEAAGEAYIGASRLLLTALEGNYDRQSTEWSGTYVSGNTHYSVQASTVCRVCNRQLTEPESIRLGIGPDCRRTPTPDTGYSTSDPRPPEDENNDSLEVDEVDMPTAEQTRRLMPLIENAALAINDPDLIRIMRHERNEYGMVACEYCGRNDFMQPQGLGRHVSSCRRRYAGRTMLERYPDRVAYLRETDSRVGSNRVIHPAVARSLTRTVPSPQLTALGTRVAGRVWEQ